VTLATRVGYFTERGANTVIIRSLHVRKVLKSAKADPSKHTIANKKVKMRQVK